MSSKLKRQQQQIERIATQEPPPSLERAFQELDSLDRRHPESRGMNYGTIIVPRTAQDARSNAK